MKRAFGAAILPRLAILSMGIGAGLILPVSALGAATADAGQTYPNKPVRVVTYEPGGGGDFVARVVAQGLTAALGQQVIVDNRGGGGGAVAAQTVAKAVPDGYTLLFYGNSIWLLPLMQDKVSWDPIRDFSPVVLTFKVPLILVVHPSLAANSVKDLIALAKSEPARLNYASNGSGSNSHLAAELFKAMAATRMVHVPYKGAGIALSDLIGGQVQLMFPVATAAQPHIKSGKLRALAITSAQPSELFPGLPTMAATLPGYEAVGTNGVFAPSRTPMAIIERLNREIAGILSTPDTREKLLNAGAEPLGGPPQQFAATIKADMERMGKVIKEVGIRAD